MAQRMESKLVEFSLLLNVREPACPVVPHTSPFRHSVHPHEHLLCPTGWPHTGEQCGQGPALRDSHCTQTHTNNCTIPCLQTVINVPKEERRVLAEPVLEKLIWEAPRFLGASGI